MSGFSSPSSMSSGPAPPMHYVPPFSSNSGISISNNSGPPPSLFGLGPNVPISHEPAPEDPHLGGVGIVFVEGVARDRIAVITLVNGGPADRDGTVQPGDLVASVDGANVLGQSLNQVRQRVLGEPGTRCLLSFDRPSTSSTYSVSLVRESKSQQMERERGASDMLRQADHRLMSEREARRRLEIDANRISTEALEARAQMQDEITALKAHMDREHDARLAAEAQLRMMKQEIDRNDMGLSAKLEEVNNQLRGERDLRMRADEEVRRLLAELERLQRERETMVSQTRHQLNLVSEDARSAHVLRARADGEVEELRNELAALTDARTKAELRAREAENCLIRERNSREKEASEAMQNASRLGQQLVEAERQLRESNDARANLEERLHRMMAESENIRRESDHTISALRTETERLKHELESWTSRKSAIEKTVATAQEEIVRERSLHDRAENAAQHLSDQLLREKNARAQAEQKLVALTEDLRQRTASLQAAEKSLGDAIQRLREMESTRQFLERDIQNKNAEMAKARDELQRAADRLGREQSMREQLEHQNRVNLENEGAKHLRALEEVKQRHQGDIMRTVNDGKARLQALQEQLDILNAQLQASHTEIARRNEALGQTDRTLKTAIEQHRIDQLRIAELEKQLQVAEQRMEQARANLGLPVLGATTSGIGLKTYNIPNLPNISNMTAPSPPLNGNSLSMAARPPPPPVTATSNMMLNNNNNNGNIRYIGSAQPSQRPSDYSLA